ncbi:MAG: dipeptidase [bacterium]|nr:dipeptidase [bacterium]
MKTKEFLNYLESNKEAQLEELKAWLRIPSISCQKVHDDDMEQTARMLTDHLDAMGMEHVELIKTASHPLIYCDWLKAGADKPTVLIYGHYDVQPVDPIEKWVTPPFEPTERDGNLYARGASDDKGQFYAHVKAVQALLETGDTLPVNVKIIVEGDEESGAPVLHRYLEANPGRLAADVCLISDTALLSPDQPILNCGLRGITACEVVVHGPGHDLHSGSYGGVVHNPAQALAELIAGLHDSEGRVSVPGFYEDVVELTEKEKKEFAKVPLSDSTILEETGVPALYGEPGYTPVERLGSRPTLEINGMWGGFIDEGFMTVIPAEAHARISCRLVAHQDPKKIEHLICDHFKKTAPSTVSVEVKSLAGVGAALLDPNSTSMKAAYKAYEKAFGTAPVFTREGGGIPIVSDFQDILKAQVVLMGFGLMDDNIHAPNEKIHLPNFFRGIRTVAYFLEELAVSWNKE